MKLLFIFIDPLNFLRYIISIQQWRFFMESVESICRILRSLAVEHLINIVEQGQSPYGIRETTSVEPVNISNIPILLR